MIFGRRSRHHDHGDHRPVGPRAAVQYGPAMSQPRIEMNATLLPKRGVLALGARHATRTRRPRLNAECTTRRPTRSARRGECLPRLYHPTHCSAGCDVALVGSNPTQGLYEQHIEILSPAYCSNADGSRRAPSVTGCRRRSPTGDVPGANPDAADIASWSCAPGAPTHAFDMDRGSEGVVYGRKRLLSGAPPERQPRTPVTTCSSRDSAGVPSIASFVQLTAAFPCRPHRASRRPARSQHHIRHGSVPRVALRTR